MSPEENPVKNERNSRLKGIVKKILAALLILILVLAAGYAASNLIVCLSEKDRIKSVEEVSGETGFDCILVLGCGVWGDTPSHLLTERLEAALKLYEAGVAPKLLMSGDHGRSNYNEVAVMRQYALDHGVPSEDIFMDHAGFSTYETMYRAFDVFGVRKAVIVTQEYHLARALFDASAFGMEVLGAKATGHVYASQTIWEIRESIARTKDAVWCIFKPEPTYRGDRIDIHGNGEQTLD